MLTIKSSTRNKHHRVALSGELTIYTALQAKRELPAHLAKGENLELDLDGIEELDTAGVQVLLWLKRGAAAQGRSLPFVYHSPAVIDVLNLLWLGGTLGDPVLLDGPSR